MLIIGNTLRACDSALASYCGIFVGVSNRGTPCRFIVDLHFVVPQFQPLAHHAISTLSFSHVGSNDHSAMCHLHRLLTRPHRPSSGSQCCTGSCFHSACCKRLCRACSSRCARRAALARRSLRCRRFAAERSSSRCFSCQARSCFLKFLLCFGPCILCFSDGCFCLLNIGLCFAHQQQNFCLGRVSSRAIGS